MRVLPVLPVMLAACGGAPSDPGPDVEPWRAPVARLVEEALTRGQAYELLGDLCRTAPRRLSGSAGAQRAVEWARASMLEAGLENVRLEECTVPHWERGDVAELIVTAPPARAGTRLPVCALGGSVATPPEGVEAEVVLARGLDELAALQHGALGRIVLLARPMDDALIDTFAAYSGAVDQRGRGAVEAARAGATAVLVRSMTTRRDDLPHTGAMNYDDAVRKIPAAAVSTNGADELASWLAAGEAVQVRLRMNPRREPDALSFNVIGELVGTELPDEIVALGGHLDAWDLGEGAHDDGAGCCQTLEAVRLIRELGLRPRRTLRVVLFMNEENGTAGARAYHAAHRRERHVLALESDRGGFAPRGFTTDARGPLRALLEEAARLVEPIGAGKVIDGFGGVDVAPLAADGVPTVGFLPDCQRYFDVHHTSADTFAAVHERELELGAAAIAALVLVVADHPGTL